jgi:sugar-specific transcriptional regulator TrmB
MLEEKLKQLGFNDKEIAVYLDILKKGKARAAQIARDTDINRTTVYATADTLVDKGVIKEDLAGKSKYYVAGDPSDLTNLIERKRRKLNEKEATVEDVKEELETIQKSDAFSVPKLEFIEEGEIKDFLFEISPTWNESMLATDQTIWGFQDHSLVDDYGDWIEWYWENKPEEIVQKMYTNAAPAEEELEAERFRDRGVRFWEGETDFTASVWVAGDYLLLMKSDRRPHYLVHMHDPVLAHNLREYFKQTWKQLGE